MRQICLSVIITVLEDERIIVCSDWQSHTSTEWLQPPPATSGCNPITHLSPPPSPPLLFLWGWFWHSRFPTVEARMAGECFSNPPLDTSGFQRFRMVGYPAFRVPLSSFILCVNLSSMIIV